MTHGVSADLLNHAWYAVARPHDCLCGMCMRAKPCATCGKPSALPIKSRRRIGYTPYCMKHAVVAAKKARAHG